MSTKKTFKADINPALRFISQPEVEDVGGEEKAPVGFKQNPKFVETKSRRLQLLIQPSLYDKLRERAVAQGKSVNDLVHGILLEALL